MSDGRVGAQPAARERVVVAARWSSRSASAKGVPSRSRLASSLSGPTAPPSPAARLAARVRSATVAPSSPVPRRRPVSPCSSAST
ncbi:hypothetical protein [Oerskovia rustica]|uniref:hypothetical protein n=1 Tax=Oerskovia rustica TaxID=2762237 RepID=UPI001CD849F9|nr:hypothetical protein [Oerskovia rustica]